MKVVSPINTSYLTKGKAYDLIEPEWEGDLLLGGIINCNFNKKCSIVTVEPCPHLHFNHWIVMENDHDHQKEAGSSCHREDCSRP